MRDAYGVLYDAGEAELAKRAEALVVRGSGYHSPEEARSWMLAHGWKPVIVVERVGQQDHYGRDYGTYVEIERWVKE